MTANKQNKAKITNSQRPRKGRRPPPFVKIRKSKKNIRIDFPVAAHRIEKRIMGVSFVLGLSGFATYYYLKPDTALLTEGMIPYQIAAIFFGLVFSGKFLNMIMSRFYINLSKVGADLYYGPLAKRRIRKLYSQRIQQIYVEQVETFFGFKYHVLAITKNQREHTVYVTYHSRLAKYIENMLEDFMGVKNKPVAGAVGSKSSSEEYL